MPGFPKQGSFVQVAKASPNETVWFSFIIFKNRKHRDEVNKKVMAHMGKVYEGVDMVMPFDSRKMAYGGFKAVVVK